MASTKGQVAIGKASPSARHLRGQVAIEKPSASARNLRGQVATEFFLYVSVFMFVAISAFFIVDRVQSTEIPQREATIARDTGDFFASSISLAVKAGNGFTYRYGFPRTILGNPYTLTISPERQAMVLDWEGRYGNFSQYYTLPAYPYQLTDPNNCISASSQTPGAYVFDSSEGSDTLTLANDGHYLHIFHGGCP